MGNFEKLGILVIIVLVVVIIVVAAWGVRSEGPPEAPLVAANSADRVEPPDDRPDPPEDDRRIVVPPIRDDEEGQRTPVPPVRPVRPKRYHVVQANENPWKIAERYYGKGHLCKLIEKANPTVEFDPLPINAKLLIPYLDEQAAPAPRRENPAVSGGGKEYVIQNGDTLWDIAKEQLGDATRHKEILAKNPGLNEHRLRAGITILLPAR